MTKKATTPPAPAGEQTEAVALSRIPAFQPIELEIVRDVLPMKGRQYDVSTPDGLAEAKADKKTITSYLTRLESARKVTKDEPYKLCLLIDAEAKRIALPVELEIKAPLVALIEAEEGRQAAIEAARVDAIRSRIQMLTRRPGWGAKAIDIRTMLNFVETVLVDAAYAELQDEAVVAQAEALRDLRAMLATAEDVERQQAELKAGHARLAEQVAQQQAAELVAGDVTGPPTGQTIVVQMLDDPRPVGPPSTARALGEIIELCDALAFGADAEAAPMIAKIKLLAQSVLARA